MKPIAIVQARISGATRFGSPKVLADIGGRSMLERVMERLQRCKTIKGIVLAIPENEANQTLSDYCEAHQWNHVMGPEDDVLKRYALAAQFFNADPVVRVTADCPLIDWGVVDGVVRLYESSGADYVSNNLERTWPHGLDVEAFSLKALLEADAKATDAFDREHVTEYIRRNQDRPYRLANLQAPLQSMTVLQSALFVASRWTVDYPEDLELVRLIFAAFPEDHFVTTADAIGLLEEHPEWLEVNEQRALEHANQLGHSEPVSEEGVKAMRRAVAKSLRQRPPSGVRTVRQPN